MNSKYDLILSTSNDGQQKSMRGFCWEGTTDKISLRFFGKYLGYYYVKYAGAIPSRSSIQQREPESYDPIFFIVSHVLHCNIYNMIVVKEHVFAALESQANQNLKMCEDGKQSEKRQPTVKLHGVMRSNIIQNIPMGEEGEHGPAQVQLIEKGLHEDGRLSLAQNHQIGKKQ
ncbi:hypothetical protein B0H19DRAFT_1068132 [Mycena capillaripes]|nr:hypothetical protein B0H19DRAFT_1068132 [Mycena capillaripes]